MQELIRAHHPDFICLSESNKEKFTNYQLEAIDVGLEFVWNWLPAENTTRGVLVGVKDDVFEIISCDIHIFSVALMLRNKIDNNI